MAKFDLNDSGVVVIVGSGAGGGTLGNELAQKGVKVVILEAGPRIENQDFINDEWDSFTQLAWSDARSTSGSWRVHQDFPGLPAWIVKAVGGSTTHWAGRLAALRRARVQDQVGLWHHSRRQPDRLADHARRDGAVVRQGRGQDGRHPHQRHPRAARQQ
ncbi:flavin-dependent dehydrogenase [Bradyrhizobium sp. USDA 4523]